MDDLCLFAVLVGELSIVVFGSLFLVLLIAEIASNIQARREKRKRERLKWRR